MGLRTSVSGCISLLGIVSVATGCSGQAPGQASLARLGLSGGAGMALARQLATTPGVAGKAPAAAIAEAEKALKNASPEDLKALAAMAQVATGDAKPAAAPMDGAKPAAPAAEAVPAPAAPAVPTAPVAPAEPAQAATPEAAPALGFTLGGLLDTVMPGAAADDAASVIFRDGFDDGLASWVSRGLGLPQADAEDAVVLAGTKARKSLWIKTRTEIDLAASQEPRLRLDFKGAPVTLKAVWETDAGAFTEEILLTAAEPAKDAAKDAAPEFDLRGLRGRPGHLVLVARAPKGEDHAPVLDAVTIYDAQVASR